MLLVQRKCLTIFTLGFLFYLETQAHKRISVNIKSSHIDSLWETNLGKKTYKILPPGAATYLF